jgi:hypothetical protein
MDIAEIEQAIDALSPQQRDALFSDLIQEMEDWKNAQILDQFFVSSEMRNFDATEEEQEA